MAGLDKKAGANTNQARTARARRRITGLSLGVLLASFGAIVATGVPGPAPDLLRDIAAGPSPTPTADPASQVAARPGAAAARVGGRGGNGRPVRPHRSHRV